MIKIKLRAARINAGLSQPEVAKMIKKSKSTVIAWEKGQSQIDLANFKMLSDIYKIPMEMIDVEVKDGNSRTKANHREVAGN